MKYLGIAVGVLVILLCWTAAVHGQTALQVVADSTEIEQTDSFYVHIVAGSPADTLSDLYGIGFQLQFDPAAFRVDDGVKGAFWGAETVLEFGVVDSVAGFAAYSVTLTAPPGLTGHGTIASFHVHARLDGPLGDQELSLADLDAIDSNGEGVAFTLVSDTIEVTPWAVTLVPSSESMPSDDPALFAYPNPARHGEARVFYRIPMAGPIKLSVYTPAGRLVRELMTGHVPATGGTLVWDGSDSRGREASPGLYLLLLETDRGMERGRVTLIR